MNRLLRGDATLLYESQATRDALTRFAAEAGALADKKWKVSSYGVLRQNALRMLVATSPDLQTC